MDTIIDEIVEILTRSDPNLVQAVHNVLRSIHSTQKGGQDNGTS